MLVAVTLESITTERPSAADGDWLYVILAGYFGAGRVVRVQPEAQVAPDMAVAWVTRARETRVVGQRLHEWELSDFESLQVCCAFAARRRGKYADAVGIAMSVADAFESPLASLMPLAGGPSATPLIAGNQDAPIGEVTISASNVGGDLTTTIYYAHAATSYGKGIVTEGSSTMLSLLLTGSGARYVVKICLSSSGE